MGIFESGHIESVETIAKRMRLIRVKGPDVAGLGWTPGQQVRVRMPGRIPALRTYSVWNLDGDSLELCVFDHGGDGPGARWGRETAPGQEVSFRKPEGKFVTRSAPYHLFAGEETAAVAFGAMLRSLPAEAKSFAVVEVDSPEDRPPLPSSVGWVYRHSAPAASSASLVAAGGRRPAVSV